MVWECGRKTVTLAWQEAHVWKERELRKGEKLGDLLTCGMVEDWKQDEEQMDEKVGLDLRWLKWAASEKSSEKSLVVKGGGWRVGGLESEQNVPLAACIQELGWTPAIWVMHPRNHSQREWLIPLKHCCADRIASATFRHLEWLRSAL